MHPKVKQNEVICRMKKLSVTYNETVKEAIALAVLKHLQTKALNQISISEITQTAGVSRSSFYRNFDTKEQALSYYVQKCYKAYFQHGTIQLQTDHQFDFNHFLYLRFRFIKQNRDMFTTLRKHNLLSYIFEDLDPELAQILSGMKLDSPYYTAMFASCSAGIIRQWIDNDFKETEEEMIQIHLSISKLLHS